MGLKDHFQRSITMTVLQRNCMVVVTLLSTLLLITIWPRFRNDALSLEPDTVIAFECLPVVAFA